MRPLTHLLGRLCLVCALVLASAPIPPAWSADSPIYRAPIRYLPAAPDEMTLCGEKVPLDDPFVYEAFDREFQIAVHDQAQVVMWLKRAHRYFPYFEKRLKEKGLPDDLKYLAVAESSLLHQVCSVAGAAGTWQFMPRTGKSYGLRVDDWVDERRNPHKSTDAALEYLQKIHDQFNSWTLAMAAYNCGENRVEDSMAEQGTKDYYQLWLPQETMRYIYRILAAKVVLANPSKYGYVLSPRQLYEPLQGDLVTFRLGSSMHLKVVAQAAGVSWKRLRDMNPEIIDFTIPRGEYTLLVPEGTAGRVRAAVERRSYAANVEPPPAQAPRGVVWKKAKPAPKNSSKSTWVVKKGQTLSEIAHRTGASVKEIKKANRLSSNNIRAGQTLIIPN
ncbi:MAG: transglycosylase SLT domain-containing protein [Deltaproteobacteria bacterium]|nr:transglycosylase SLT domain-containing protein [Deltaproteobacteria bacterium]